MNAPLLSRLSRRLGWLLFLVPFVAQAHPGHPEPGVAAGFAHPCTGVDHPLALIAVGLWAAQLGGRARWAIPASFTALVGVGFALAAAGVALPFVGTVVLVSLTIVGICIFGMVRLPLAWICAGLGGFAIWHGNAHGAAALPGLAAESFGVGLVLATAALQGLGLILGRWALTYPNPVLRFCGGTLALGGIGLLLS